MRKVHDLARILEFAEEAGFNTLRRPLVTSSANRAKIPDRLSKQLQDMVKDEGMLILMQKEIHDSGVFIGAVTPPVVPPNKSRFRISVMSTHIMADMDRLLNVMESMGKKYQVI